MCPSKVSLKNMNVNCISLQAPSIFRFDPESKFINETMNASPVQSVHIGFTVSYSINSRWTKSPGLNSRFSSQWSDNLVPLLLWWVVQVFVPVDSANKHLCTALYLISDLLTIWLIDRSILLINQLIIILFSKWASTRGRQVRRQQQQHQILGHQGQEHGSPHCTASLRLQADRLFSRPCYRLATGLLVGTVWTRLRSEQLRV